MPRGESYLLQGQQGGDVFDVSNGGGVDGNWRVILAVEDSVLDVSFVNIDDPVGVTFNLRAGTALYGRVTYIGLTSGTVIAYFDDF